MRKSRNHIVAAFAAFAAFAALALGLSPAVALAQAGGNYISGHLAYNGSAGGGGTNGVNPVLSTCGTAPALDAWATDMSGRITTGSTSVSACTLTFLLPFTTNPHCRASAVSSGGTPYATGITALSPTAITITWATAMTSGFVDYGCDGH